MTFKQAVKVMRQGKKVKHRCWANNVYLSIPEEYRRMRKPYIYMTVTGKVIEPCFISQSDMESENWEEVIE